MRYSGFILSFEPESKAFYKLTKLTKRDSAWECLQYGLGSEETTMLLNVAENDGLSSTFNNTKRNEKIPKIFVSTDHCEEVKIMKLDAFQNYFQNHESVFLKIDTQGFELEVLKGGLDSFEKITCVLMEASFVEQYYDQVSIHSLINMMHSLEFDLIDVFTHGYRNRMQIECDLFFSRKPRNSQ